MTESPAGSARQRPAPQVQVPTESGSLASEPSTVAFTFDGTPLTARRGATIAAALLAAGIRAWRATRVGGRPRGLFCGIGHCFDCLVEVAGPGGERAVVRACRTYLRDGDVVRTSTSWGVCDAD